MAELNLVLVDPADKGEIWVIGEEGSGYLPEYVPAEAKALSNRRSNALDGKDEAFITLFVERECPVAKGKRNRTEPLFFEAGERRWEHNSSYKGRAPKSKQEKRAAKPREKVNKERSNGSCRSCFFLFLFLSPSA